MSSDNETIDEFLADIKDRYEVYDLVELLDLTVDDIITAFYDELLEKVPHY